MWTKEKTKHVDDIIERLTEAKHKDDLGDALLDVEEETGYSCDLIYDIFTEAAIDEEVDLNEASHSIIKSIWRGVIEPAYEYDY